MAFTQIQSGSTSLGANSPSETITLGTNVTAGSLLVITAYFTTDTVNGSNNGIRSITSTGSPSWIKAVASGGDVFNGNPDAEIWYAANAPAGATTITISHSRSTLYTSPGFAWAVEYGGVATTSPLVTTGTGVDKGSATTHLASVSGDTVGDLVVSLCGVYNGTDTPTISGYTNIGTNTNVASTDNLLTGSTATNYNVTYTTVAFVFGTTVAATFKVAPPPQTSMFWGGMLLDLSIFPQPVASAVQKLFMMMGIGS